MEFSYLIKSDDINETQKEYKFSADADQRAALAKRYEILGIKNLDAKVKVHRQNGFLITVKGHFEATLIQTCVVSLEDVETLIEDEFEAFFTDREDTVSFAKARHKHIQENQDPETSFLDENDDPEKVSNGRIDLGETVAQFLSLSIPSYPHKQGIAFEGPSDAEVPKTQAAPHKQNPFAALEALKSSESYEG